MSPNFKLSPSSINLFIEEPALFIIKHFFGIRGSSNIHAVRGKIAEDVINYKLEFGKLPTEDQFIKYVLPKVFFDDVEIEEQHLRQFYNWGKACDKVFVEQTKDLGKLVSAQREVSGNIEGLRIAGFIDFEFEGIIIDLKTVNKTPSLLVQGVRKGMLPSFKAANIRQQIIYSILSKKSTSLLFIDENGSNLLYKISEQDVVEHTPIITSTIKNIKKILDTGLETAIISYRPKNTDSMYWDDLTRSKARELWTT